MLSAATIQGGQDIHPTTVEPYTAPIAPPDVAILDPIRLAGPVFGPPPATAIVDPIVDHTHDAPPSWFSSGGPSIGIGYTPPVRRSIDVPASAADTSPTTLPTVTTWARNLPSNWRVIAAAAVIALILILAYRRWRG